MKGFDKPATHPPTFGKNVRFNVAYPLSCLVKSAASWPSGQSTDGSTCKARDKSRAAAPSASSPIVVGRGAPSRITKPKPTKKKVLDSQWPLARQSYRKRRDTPTIADAAVLQASAAATTASSPALPSLAREAQDGTATSLGPPHTWGPIGLPMYSGNVGTLDMSSQVGFPVGLSAHDPQISDRYQSPCLGDASASVPSSGSMHSTWDQAGFHLSFGRHTQPEHLTGYLHATNLPYDYMVPRSSLPNNSSHLSSFTQHDPAGNMSNHPYLELHDEGAYFGMPTMELDSSLDLSNPMGGEWIVVDSQGQSREAGNVAEEGQPRPTWLIPDGLPNLTNDSAFVDPVASPESDAAEVDSDDESDDAPIVEEEDADGSQKRTRTRLNPEKRQQTGTTRKMKACVRCRMQKIRVRSTPMTVDLFPLLFAHRLIRTPT